MDFIYLVVIVILIVLLAKKSHSEDTQSELYAKGYADGRSALSATVATLLNAPKFDKNAIQAAIEDQQPDAAVPAESKKEVVESAKVQPDVSPQEQAHPHRNLNIMLYLASFLFVSAGAAFISTEMPDSVKLIGAWIVTFAFYLAGLELYKRATHLRPAALAFTGTGLAMIPFAGIALYSFGGVDGAGAWLFSSALGVILYIIAALRLQNSVVSYLTMAFVLSLVSSSIETLSMPILWQFVGMITVALIASIAAFIKPSWLPLVFRDPIEKTGQYLTPIALGASLVVPYQVTLLGYEIIFGIAAAHYLVAWLQRRELIYEYAARATVHIWLLFVGWDITTGDLVSFGLLFLSLAMFQLVYSLYAWPRQKEIFWMDGALLLQFLSVCFWSGSENAALLTSSSFAVLAIGSFLALVVTRMWQFIAPFIFATIILPFALQYAMSSIPDISWIAISFVAFAAVTLALYQWLPYAQSFRKAIIAAFGSYIIMTFVMSMALTPGMAALTLAVAALLCGVASYILKLPWIFTGMVVFGWVAFMRALLDSGGNPGWLVMASVWATAGASYLASWLLLQNKDHVRHKALLFSAWFVAGCGIMGYFADPVLKEAATWTLAAVAITIIAEGYRLSNKTIAEIGMYIGTFSLQYLLALAAPDISMVVYAHWWAAVIAAVALWRQQWLPRLAIAMGIITYMTAGYALNYGGGYALLFLVEHVALVALGVHLNRDWVIWWGIVASAAAVLYFLRDIAFLAFAFLGLLLIGLAIWRLRRISKK